MVGVAGRSKGCATCRRRKVKCDETFPQCRNCVGMKAVCPGPRTGALFINTLSESSKLKQQDRQRRTAQPNSLVLHKQSDSNLEMPDFSQFQICRANAFDTLFLSHFIDSFGQNKPQPASPQEQRIDWLDMLPIFIQHPSNQLLKNSIRSASMISYGSWSRDASIQADAYQWYGKALGTLRGLLPQQQLASGESIEYMICAAVMLSHFEANTNHESWLHHIHGAASLLVMAGPKVCQRGFLNSVFRHMRLQVFLASMENRKVPTFASDKWMSTPFKYQPKTTFDTLTDILFKLQQCLVEFDEIRLLGLSEDSSETRQQNLGVDAESILLQLRNWERDLLADYIFQSLLVGDIKPPKLDLASLAKTSVSAAALISLFHSANVVIFRILMAIGNLDIHNTTTCYNHALAVLHASHFVGSVPGATRDLGPIMLVPQLKIVSLWAPDVQLRQQAQNILEMENLRPGAFANVAKSSGGYFSALAKYLDANVTAHEAVSTKVTMK